MNVDDLTNYQGHVKSEISSIKSSLRTDNNYLSKNIIIKF
jgi:hypothetical protein